MMYRLYYEAGQDDNDNVIGYSSDVKLLEKVRLCLETQGWGRGAVIEPIDVFETFEDANKWWKDEWGHTAELDSLLTTHPKWNTIE